MDILFKNITIITMLENHQILHDSCVGVTGKKITYIGKFTEQLKSKRIIDGTNKVLIPGLYNCHTHTPMSLLRGYANDKKLQDWLYNHIFPAEDRFKSIENSTYIGALISIADMIESGTIAFSDMYFNMPHIAKAVFESGIKACLSNPVLPLEIENYHFFDDNCYFETKEVLEQYIKSCDRIKVDVGIHAEYTSNPNIWCEVIDFAYENKLNIHIHLSETKYEHEECKNKYKMTPTQIFNQYNLFNIKTTAAHCVWLEECDMDILEKCNVTVVNSPISNLKLASGIAPIDDILNKNINVALGTDGVSSNNSNDLFEEIKMVSLLQKYKYDDTTKIKAYDALKMATANGALAHGRENESGRIKVGYDADVVMLDFNNTRQTACYDYLSNIVYSCTGRDVLLTMCQGKVLYENGEHKTIDIEKLLYDARKIINKFVNI